MKIESWMVARAFAIEAHGEQKYGGKPYVAHLDEVATVVSGTSLPFGPRPLYENETLIVAYLHDILEDTSVRRGEIAEIVSDTVAEAVAFCTDEPGPNRKTRKIATHARCREKIQAWMLGRSRTFGVPIGAFVKVSDRIANMRACLRDPDVTFEPEGGKRSLLSMYVEEHDVFRYAYGWDEHVRYGTQSNDLWDELEALVAFAKVRIGA